MIEYVEYEARKKKLEGTNPCNVITLLVIILAGNIIFIGILLNFHNKYSYIHIFLILALKKLHFFTKYNNAEFFSNMLF